MKHASLLLFLITLLGLTGSYAQTRINIIQSQRAEYNKFDKPDVQRLVGNVIFEHDGAYLYCDSAYFNTAENSVEAFAKRIRIQINDSVVMYGQHLYYDGNARVARMEYDVEMSDNSATLTTDYVWYDRNINQAYYNTGGKIVSRDEKTGNLNTLTSRRAYYFTTLKEVYFRQDVVLTSETRVAHSDTLLYNTSTEVATFLGPTVMTGERDSLWCTYGRYDTRHDIAHITDRGKIVSENRLIIADTMHLQNNCGTAIGRAFLRDSNKDMQLRANYVFYDDSLHTAVATDSAIAILIDKQDSLFLHADTLRAAFDSTNDVTQLQAYYGVRFYRDDLQGSADSLHYRAIDSTITLYANPALWQESNQITADTLIVWLRGKKVHRIDLNANAFVAEEDSSATRYNQIKGLKMSAHFRENKLYRIDVDGNAESLYYVTENSGEDIGVNHTESSRLVIHVENNKVKGITCLSDNNGLLNNPDEVSEKDTLLKGFRWLSPQRPLSKYDIFRKE